MNKLLGVVSLAAVFAVATSVVSSVAIASEEKKVSKTYEFDAHGNVSVENINGDITVSGWDKDEILLEYVITADNKEDLEKIKVEVEHSKRDFDVEVDMESSSSFFGWGDGSSGEIEFTLKVPKGSTLRSIESVNGDIEISNVSNEVVADTVNGKIVVRNAASDVKFGTVNGDVEIHFDQIQSSNRVKGDSVNGDIEVYLPENDGFELRTDTVNGDLSNDFGIEVDEGEYVGAEMEGEYKSGGASLKFDTVNGDIEIRKK